jgi:hypothetical protein
MVTQSVTHGLPTRNPFGLANAETLSGHGFGAIFWNVFEDAENGGAKKK